MTLVSRLKVLLVAACCMAASAALADGPAPLPHAPDRGSATGGAPPDAGPGEQHGASGEGCICTMQYDPVCAAAPGGGERTWPNACHARCAGATGIRPGAC